jgi:hypothetical protein
MSVQRSARDAAEAKFAARSLRHQEAQRATSEYEAENRRIAENTARLKALRLAKEAAESEAGPKKPAPKRPAAKTSAAKTPAPKKPATRRKAPGR